MKQDIQQEIKALSKKMIQCFSVTDTDGIMHFTEEQGVIFMTLVSLLNTFISVQPNPFCKRNFLTVAIHGLMDSLKELEDK